MSSVAVGEQTSRGPSSSARVAPGATGTFVPVGAQVVLAIDPVAGGYVWGVQASAGLDSFVALTVADDVLYGMWGSCASDQSARSVGVAAFDALSGSQRWRTAPLFTGGQGVDWVMAGIDDGIYVAIGATDDGGTAMVGIDAASGAQRWRVDRLSGYSLYQPNSAVASDSMVVAIGTADHGEVIGGWDRATGERRWTIKAPDGDTILGVDAGDGVALAGFGSGGADDGQGFADFEVRAYNVTDGTERWTLPDASVAPQAISGGVAVLQENDGGGPIFGVDVATGKQLWRREGGWIANYRHDGNGLLAITSYNSSMEDVIAIVSGETRWQISGSALAAPPTGFLRSTDHVGKSFSLLDINGVEIGPIQLPEPTVDQRPVAPVASANNLVYSGRGCPVEPFVPPDDPTFTTPT